MGPATQTDETTRIAPLPTADTFPDEQEKEASAVIMIIVVLVVTALLVLLLVTMVIGIVILKVKRSKTFSPAHFSEETFDMNGMQREPLYYIVVVEVCLVYSIFAGVRTVRNDQNY